MKIASAYALAGLLSMSGFQIDSAPKKVIDSPNELHSATASQKIQVAILLDVSNSMDGLIQQAKAQLWNMVSVMGKVKCANGNPNIEIALYEYGRSTNDLKAGYVKQITGFTSDLDQLSQDLFKLTTNGGNEYCGHVIYTSLDELKWDSLSSSYKVIFIAGNEDFLQGDIQYTQSCDKAKRKGVIVNTIYCGDRMQGIREHWNLGGECGDGSFTNINQNARIEDIPTPYDTTLVTLNQKLNSTYIGYGDFGITKSYRMDNADRVNGFSSSVSAKRITVKGNNKLYKNPSWDLVDANADDSTIVSKVDMKTLPDSLKNKSRVELREIVDNKTKERAVIQKEILTVSSQREKYIEVEKSKSVTTNNTQTLETEIEKIVRSQVQRFNMRVE